jgi:hypothetical protein
MAEEGKSFWSTIPGIITAFATLITAIGGFIVVLNQVGVFGTRSEPQKDNAPTVVSKDGLENLGGEEIQQKQSALEVRLKDMEQQLERERQKQPSSSSRPSERDNRPFQETAQIAGSWFAGDGAYYVVTQSGVSVFFQEYYNVYGVQTRTAGGQGTVIGRKVFFDVVNIHGATGKAELTLSGDNMTLSGVVRDNTYGTVTNVSLARSFDELE